MGESYKILIKYTTRGRVERFFDGLDNIYSMTANPDLVYVLVTADLDDFQMNNESVWSRLEGYKNLNIVYGTSHNKIHAINRDFDRIPLEFKDWDIVANFSDDQRWTVFGFDELIRADFRQYSPDLTYYMAYLDNDTNGALSTLYIAGRKWYNTFGFIYDGIFSSLFCDNLVEDCARHLGRYNYTGYSIYHHYNPSYGYKDFKPDAMYLEQQKIGWSLDMDTYNKIIAKGIPEYLKQFNL